MPKLVAKSIFNSYNTNYYVGRGCLASKAIPISLSQRRVGANRDGIRPGLVVTESWALSGALAVY